MKPLLRQPGGFESVGPVEEKPGADDLAVTQLDEGRPVPLDRDAARLALRDKVSEDNHCVVTRCKEFVEFLMPLPPSRYRTR